MQINIFGEVVEPEVIWDGKNHWELFASLIEKIEKGDAIECKSLETLVVNKNVYMDIEGKMVEWLMKNHQIYHHIAERFDHEDAKYNCKEEFITRYVVNNNTYLGYTMVRKGEYVWDILMRVK